MLVGSERASVVAFQAAHAAPAAGEGKLIVCGDVVLFLGRSGCMDGNSTGSCLGGGAALRRANYFGRSIRTISEFSRERSNTMALPSGVMSNVPKAP